MLRHTSSRVNVDSAILAAMRLEEGSSERRPARHLDPNSDQIFFPNLTCSKINTLHAYHVINITMSRR